MNKEPYSQNSLSPFLPFYIFICLMRLPIVLIYS